MAFARSLPDARHLLAVENTALLLQNYDKIDFRGWRRLFAISTSFIPSWLWPTVPRIMLNTANYFTGKC